MQKRKNDVKALTTLLLSLPDEHQLRFSKYKTAQELWVAILKTFGGNEATKKTKKNLLKQQYGNFKAEGIETLEQTFNKQQVYESKVQKKSESNSHNMAFISSAKHNSGNEEVNTVSVSTVSPVSANIGTASISQDTACAYIASQSNDGEKITIQGTDVAGFDKSKVECFNCHKMGHFTRECRAPRSQDRGRRDNYRQGSKVDEQTPKALMAIDGVGWDWSFMANKKEDHALVADEEAPIEFALMAKTSAESKVFDNSLCSKNCKKNTESLNSKITDLTDKLCDSKNMLFYYKAGLSQVEGIPEFADDTVTDYSRPSPAIETKSDKKETVRKPSIKYAEQYRKPTKRVDHGSSWEKNNNTHKSKTPRTVFYKTGRPPMRTNRPYMNVAQPKRTSFYKPAHLYTKRTFQRTSAVRSQFGGPRVATVNRKFPTVNRKLPTINRKFPTGNTKFSTADLGNISYLSDYDPFDRGYVSSGQGGCKITGKGTIKTGKLEFENVYFVKDLKYNLFSVSQICDNKNSVLFTNSECIVLGRNFKLKDDSNVFLRTPRQHNMYSIDLNNVVLHKDLACLVAKASIDEYMIWHRRLGHLNFKTMNRLVRYNLVKGLPSKCFENDHTCTACLKGKQHKASCKSKLINSVTKPLHTLHIDLFGPTSVSSISHKWYCLVVTDDFSRFTWTFFLKTKDETSGILRNFKTEIENLKDLKVKIIRVEENLHVEFLENKAIEKGAGPNWLFDIDSLTKSMNYVPVVVAGKNSTNLSGTKDAASQEVKKDVSSLRYITIPNWVYDTLLESPSSNAQDTYKADAPESSGNPNPTASKTNPSADQIETLTVETLIPTVSSPVSTACFTDSQEPSRVRPIETKWVLKNKKDERGIVIRNKARLVAQGHTQVEGIDYDEVFAHVARIKAIILFLAYASFMGFTVYQMDVKSAFLYGTIDEEVYLDVRSSNIPMDKENPWGKDRTGKYVDLHLYRFTIGSLMYLTTSRLDIMFTVYACTRHQVTPKECHLHAVKRIFRYLKGHPKLGLWYNKESPFDLVAYSDGDYGGATQDRKSTTGGCQFLGIRLSMPYEALSKEISSSILLLIKTTEEGTKILATVDGMLRIVFESSIRRNLKLYDEARISSLPDAKLFENLTLMGYNISPNQKFTFQKGSFPVSGKGEGSGTPTKPHHTPFPEAQQTSPTTHSSPSLLPVPTEPLPTVIPTDTPPFRHYTRRARIAQSSALPPVADKLASPIRDTSTLPSDLTPRVTSLAADEGSMQQKLNELTALCTSLQRQQSEMVSKFEAQELEINSLKARIKLLEDKDRGVAEQSGDDTPIKGRRLDEGKEAAKRVSDDTEEMATVLTSMDAASILTSGGVQGVPTAAEVATATVSIPTGSGVVSTASPTIPTAALFFTTATDSIPYTRRKGKEKMVESDTPKKKKLQEQIDVEVARELEEEMARDA
uniref:Putative ribonuclease H-like domain-containing protein n=1 Tax=Tanacetum cinerariifolium TaxID=118510 RepID=A0A6L2LI09_TANCI|nr:putative ribonuclease H-like domain-containing protein [Tanacetum cinerariifolium]